RVVADKTFGMFFNIFRQDLQDILFHHKGTPVRSALYSMLFAPCAKRYLYIAPPFRLHGQKFYNLQI
ncbi:MAG: hypothetical protein MUO88_18290, partial [Desulfobacterales bacterium]|nr:hypothetical protein [Desulfobacterales bacterium]